MNQPAFNPAELATWAEAKQLAEQIASFRRVTGTPMGGGVAAITANADTSGIYVPAWDGGPAGFPEPNDAPNGKYWLHYRFVNGVSGVNVGLIFDKLARYGGNTMYVFTSINNNDLQIG